MSISIFDDILEGALSDLRLHYRNFPCSLVFATALHKIETDDETFVKLGTFNFFWGMKRNTFKFLLGSEEYISI